MGETKIEGTVEAIRDEVYKGDFRGKTFPIRPIGTNQGEYCSTIGLNDENEVGIKLYFYTDSTISKSEISLYADGPNLYVDIDKAQKPTPTGVKLWKLTANVSNSKLNYADKESIELYCRNPKYTDDQTNGLRTSRGTKVSVKSGTGEI